MQKIKYRLNDPRLAPRRTKLEIPGWAGKREPRANGSREQLWHCVPFSEGAQYGIELFYPYDNELHVSTRNGGLVLESDWGDPPDDGVQWPPFRNFGDTFYTYQILLDFKVEQGMAIRPMMACSGHLSGILATRSTPIRSCLISRSSRAWRSAPSRIRASTPTPAILCRSQFRPSSETGGQ